MEFRPRIHVNKRSMCRQKFDFYAMTITFAKFECLIFGGFGVLWILNSGRAHLKSLSYNESLPNFASSVKLSLNFIYFLFSSEIIKETDFLMISGGTENRLHNP